VGGPSLGFSGRMDYRGGGVKRRGHGKSIPRQRNGQASGEIGGKIVGEVKKP